MIGIIYDIEPLSSKDDLRLYDSTINPINVPSFIIFEKVNIDPEEYYEILANKIGRGHRCTVKLTKVFGKFFF